MAYIRKRLGKWQCVIRVKGKPPTTKTFLIKKDAKLWGKKTELHFFVRIMIFKKVIIPYSKNA